MKSYNEMAADVLHRIYEYEAEQKHRRKQTHARQCRFAARDWRRLLALEYGRAAGRSLRLC